MHRMDDYRSVNRANWDERVPAHVRSPDYAVARFIEDPAFLSHVVRFDMPLLGDIAGKRAVHLQCHIGTDTVSLARLGARMTGLDFSPPAVEAGRTLAAAAGANVEFVEADIYNAAAVLEPASFELAYTGIGALCWVPDIARWAAIVAALLAPGGRLFVREAHPMLWALQDSRADGLLVVDYPYFERDEATVFDEPGTYVQSEAEFEHTAGHEWNHGLGEIVTALHANGLQLTGLAEHDSVPWDALPGQMDELGNGEFRLRERPWRLAHSYTLQAVKPPS
jgi:SAM-dependent methyltransferase